MYPAGGRVQEDGRHPVDQQRERGRSWVAWRSNVGGGFGSTGCQDCWAGGCVAVLGFMQNVCAEVSSRLAAHEARVGPGSHVRFGQGKVLGQLVTSSRRPFKTDPPSQPPINPCHSPRIDCRISFIPQPTSRLGMERRRPRAGQLVSGSAGRVEEDRPGGHVQEGWKPFWTSQGGEHERYFPGQRSQT